MTKTKTLSHYKRHLRRNKTQRTNKKKHGGRSMIAPGSVYNFDSENDLNVSKLDELMQSKVPLVVRHHRMSCPHCKDFEKPWQAIENSLKNHPEYSVASFGPRATEYMNDHYYSSPVDRVPTVMVIHEDRRLPKEHTGPNTLEFIEEFLSNHGLKIKIVPIEDDSNVVPPAEPDPVSVEPEPVSVGPSSSSSSSDEPVSVEPVEPTSVQPVSVEPVEPTSVEPTSVQPVSVEPVEPASAEPASAEPSSVIDNIKTNVKGIDEKISSGLSAITDFMTKDLFTGYAAAAPAEVANPVANPTADAAANAFPPQPQLPQPPAQAPQPSTILDDKNVIVGAPQIPSIGGKSKHRKHSKKGKKTRRKHKSKRSHTKRRK